MKRTCTFREIGMENKVSYPEFFFLFFAGSIIGFLMEGLWRVIRTGVWENHSATVWGPFCIIYGVGAASLYWISGQVNELSLWKQFLIYAVIGAMVEYLGSCLQEFFFGTISWDYSGRLLNINGRVCFSMTLMWGTLGIAFSCLCTPALSRFFNHADNWPVKGLCVIMSILMAVDLLVSACAIVRWREREYDLPAKSPIGEHLDKSFDNERMEDIYNNMVFVGKDAD